jgi:magnesium transporter
LQFFGLHPLTIEDILAEESQEKCEFFEDYTFICIRNAASECVYVVHREGQVITFHWPYLDHVAKVYRRLGKLHDISLSSGWILYAVLDNVVGL